ncbi:MAG TPA: hypothetical protein VLL08_26745 [Kineosporiaceae bacterium]|nr:hypothetical protein [Kineosporiaceae bacterium]
MEFEELDQGEPDEPTGLSLLAWAAIAVICLLGGVMFMLFRTDAEPVEEPSSSTPVALPNSAPNLTTARNLDQQLGLGRICPAVTDGRKALAVSFNLVNLSDTAVTVMDVEPRLPLGGLRPSGPNTAGGTCEHPGRRAPGGLLFPGDTQLITMRFRLPKKCPQAYPVQARVALRVNQMVGMTTVPVYNDLGAVVFDSCPNPD